MCIAIKNGWVLTQNEDRELKRCDIYLEDDRITEIGTVVIEPDEFINARGMVVMPGLINTNNRVTDTILRGYSDDRPLENQLANPPSVDVSLTSEQARVTALIGCIEMLKSGTTTFVDYSDFPEEASKAVMTSGLRGIMGLLATNDERTWSERSEFMGEHRGKGRVSPMVSLMGIQLLPESDFSRAQKLAAEYDTIIHLHLAETRKEVEDFKNEHSLSPVAWLDRIDFLSDNVLAAHCSWVSEDDIMLLAERGVAVSHCPVANMKLATGAAPITEMLRHGVGVSLGTESCAVSGGADMFLTMKFASLLQKWTTGNPTALDAQTVLDLATIQGAKAIGMADDLGSIEEGKKADIILVDMQDPGTVPFHKDAITSQLVSSCSGANVNTVIVDGQVLMRDRELRRIDQRKVLKQFNSIVQAIYGNN